MLTLHSFDGDPHGTCPTPDRQKTGLAYRHTSTHRRGTGTPRRVSRLMAFLMGSYVSLSRLMMLQQSRYAKKKVISIPRTDLRGTARGVAGSMSTPRARTRARRRRRPGARTRTSIRTRPRPQPRPRPEPEAAAAAVASPESRPALARRYINRQQVRDTIQSEDVELESTKKVTRPSS